MAGPPRSAGTDAQLETLLTSFDTNYTWRYGEVKAGLRDLYEKAKRDQWDGARELPWELDVDPVRKDILPAEINPLIDYRPYRMLDDLEQRRFRHAQISWQLSQFLHGEQGALIVASQLVGAAPWMEAKTYAATQTMDEARHVEGFSRYLDEKLEWEWPINPDLKRLLDLVILDSRWDIKYLGMQILIEGLAMGAFASMYELSQEPLLKQLVHAVMRDESRHVAFGVLSLKDFYADLPEPELREREDFIIEACQLMRDRLIGDDTAECAGFDRLEVREVMTHSPILKLFRAQLFSRIVPNLKRLGLLTPRVRQAFEQLDILQFEAADPEEQDRALGL